VVEHEVLANERRKTDAEHWGIPSFAYGEMTAGEVLRYLAEAAPERVWQQLSLEQVPIKGTP